MVVSSTGGIMSVTDAAIIEATGNLFELDGFMAVRARTRRAVHGIAEQISPGMSEEEAKEIARSILASLEMRRGWHHIIVRCGSNTTKDFMERSEPGVVLQEKDIFFIDIGPVYGDFEGDAGDTFVFGDDPLHVKAKEDVREIWEMVRAKWFAEHITGVELYQFAIKTSQDLGWKLNMDLSGHRLSEYQPVGAGNRHSPPGWDVRGILRGPAARGPVLSGRNHLSVALHTKNRGRRRIGGLAKRAFWQPTETI
jgi:methionyl aminopeptidase